MKCPECGEVNCLCRFDDYDNEPIELTALDIAAYERYKERADFDYWHRGEK
jgi:hypothetical protein